jgi:DNA-binding transcriptional MocR family regulator
MDWSPTIGAGSGPMYAKIVDALAADLAGGRLRRGQQLPTHRTLAKALAVDLTTVTRAYAEARRRGLTEARVGRGTFVASEAAVPSRPAGPIGPDIDLSMNVPPQPPEADLDGRIARGLADIRREGGFAATMAYRQPGGSADERSAAAEWMRTRLPGARADCLVICPGTQTALLCLLSSVTAPGDVVLTEDLTFPGFKAAAAQVGRQVVGVAMDPEGVRPDALRSACRRHRPKAVYLTPAIHNPTTATMSAARREEVGRILRDENVILIEDDAYGRLAPGSSPLATLVPERTYLAATLSKCLAPGLRISFVVTPDPAAATRLASAIRASVQMAAPLIVALVVRWLRDGSADAIVTAVRDEAAARQRLAAQCLAGQAYRAHASGHHIWLPLPSAWSSAEFAAHVGRQGLGLVMGEAFAVGGATPAACRIALGAARDRSELLRGLALLSAALESSALRTQVV